jgi:O-antigen ligase
MGVACLNNLQPRLQPRPADAAPGGGNGVPDAEEHWGFALITPEGDPRPVYDAVQAWALAQEAAPVAHTGVYRADTDLASFEGPWTLGPLGADIGEHAEGEEPRARLTFEGTGVALTVRRGPYRAFLYVEVDGEPAPALPTDREGRAYVVLYDPLAATVTVPLAEGLIPGRHTVEVAAVRGWGQWALADWRVTWTPEGRLLYLWGLAGFASLGLLGLIAMAWAVPRVHWRHVGAGIVLVWGRIAEWVKVVGSLLLGAVTLFAAWQIIMSETLFRRLGERGEMAALALTTGLFYLSPWAVLTAVGGLVLSIIVFLQPSLGLMLTVTAMPFYAYPLSLVGKSFALAELVLLPTLAGWALRYAGIRTAGLLSSERDAARARLSKAAKDLLRPLILFVALAVLTSLTAQHRREALRELRLVVLEPALLFLALVTLPLSRRERWRIIDGLILGGVLIAVIGLVQYFLLGRVITAEGGIRRLVSIYGSPNNVGLQMGRLLPVLLAVGLWGGASDERGWVATLLRSPRRLLYLVAALPVGLALLLSLSRGALLLGVPAALITLGLLAGPRWRKATLVAVVVGLLASALLLSFPQLLGPRFAGMLDLSQGSESFRVALWHSTWAMIGDHPFLGVGPDNFLYAYRTRYVLPSAWEEFNLSHPHNLALDFAARLGLGGLVALIWMQVVFWRRALPLRRLADRRGRALALGVMASMADFLAHGLVDASYFLIDLAYIYMVSLAVIVWLDALNQRNSPRRSI